MLQCRKENALYINNDRGAKKMSNSRDARRSVRVKGFFAEVRVIPLWHVAGVPQNMRRTVTFVERYRIQKTGSVYRNALRYGFLFYLY